MNGQRLLQPEIARGKTGEARLWWAALFIFPRWLGKRIYLSPRKGGMISRLTRSVAH
jgi:hypothetical protein